MLNYFKHTTYTPNYFYQQYNQSETVDSLKYIAEVAAPIISCHKPTNDAILAVKNIVYLGSSILECQNSFKLHKLYSVVMATLSASALFFNFRLGLYITTLSDISQNLMDVWGGHHSELFPMFASILYLAIMHTGSLELTLFSLCMQVVLNTYQAYKGEDTLMCLSKLCMAAIRCNQVNLQMQLIERRDSLYELKRLESIIKRIETAKKVEGLYNHPLTNLAQRIHDGKCTLENVDGEEFEFGTYFSRMGKGSVKGMNICCRTDDEHTAIEFKVNHVAREKLDIIVAELTKTKELKELISYKSLNFTDVKVRSVGNVEYMAKEIEFKGLGTITLGSAPEVYDRYNTVTIKLNEDSSLYDFHAALSLLDLQDALALSSQEDIERMKLGQIFRLFNPKQATELERQEFFFDASIDALKERMIDLDPTMKGHIDNDIDRLVFQDTIKGKERLHYMDLHKELENLGAKELTAMITTGWNDDENVSFERLCNILKMGLLSSELKQQGGIVSKGLNNNLDYYGSNDSVFVQMTTEATKSYDELAYSNFGDIRLKINLKALDSISYQYHDDICGIRNLNFDAYWYEYIASIYYNRPQIHEFVELESQGTTPWHELMIKDTIAPDLIDGIVVRDENAKQITLSHLRQANLVELNNEGLETINKRLVEDFIQVGQDCI
jgi:hypothetical protein